MIAGVAVAVTAFVVTFQGLASFIFALSMEALMRAFFGIIRKKVSEEDGCGGVTLRVPKGSPRTRFTAQ